MTDNRVKSKKTSGNHLLNFTTYERPTKNTSFQPRRKNNQSFVPFNKEKFVHAHYNFVVSDQTFFPEDLRDPDVVVDWNSVEEVILHVSTPYECPICLEACVVPKVTNCGHIFCWTCLIRHLSKEKPPDITQGVSGKCPICFEHINLKNAKSIVLQPTTKVKEGDKIKFCLLKRNKDSLVPIPSSFWTGSLSRYPLNTDFQTRFARVTITKDIKNIIEREEQELGVLLKEALSAQDDSVQYVIFAQECLKMRKELFESGGKLGSLKSPQITPKLSDQVAVSTMVAPHVDENFEAWADEELPQPSRSEARNITSIQSKENQMAMSPNNATSSGNTNLQASTEDAVFFYQSEDASLIYMHPLNVRMLLHEFGLENLPKEVEAQVVESEDWSQTDETRKRFRNVIGHLPLGTPFQLMEVNFQPQSLCSTETRTQFAEQLDARARKRFQRVKKARENQNKESSLKDTLRELHIKHTTQNPYLLTSTQVMTDSPQGAEHFPAIVSPNQTTENSEEVSGDSEGVLSPNGSKKTSTNQIELCFTMV